MNLILADLTALIIFIIIIVIFFIKKRSRFEIQGKVIALYKTKIGLKKMDILSRLPTKFLTTLSVISISLGFAGMFIICYLLIKETAKLFFVPGTAVSIAPVLPYAPIPGLPSITFFHWIISIFVVAVIHEFSHGVFARFNKIRIKSSGFAFFGPILAAFVEPDEKQLNKQSRLAQLSVFSAGPFSNIVTGFIFILIASFLVTPALASSFDVEGIKIVDLEENYPALEAGLEKEDIILSVNSIPIESSEDLTNVMKEIKPGETIIVETKRGEFSVQTTSALEDQEIAVIGISVTPELQNNKTGLLRYGAYFLFWFSKLLNWIIILSLGIGLANLLPIGPVDGGRMLYTFLGSFIKRPKITKRIWNFVSYFVLLLIIVNILFYIGKYVITPLSGVIG